MNFNILFLFVIDMKYLFETYTMAIILSIENKTCHYKI